MFVLSSLLPHILFRVERTNKLLDGAQSFASYNETLKVSVIFSLHLFHRLPLLFPAILNMNVPSEIQSVGGCVM